MKSTDVLVIGSSAARLAINHQGFIEVDEYMRTDDPDIFAVGDCAEKKGFFTRKTSTVMLASTACAEARIDRNYS